MKLKDQLIDCAQTYTNSLTHELVMSNQHLLPDYDGADGAGVGPRFNELLHMFVYLFRFVLFISDVRFVSVSFT